MNSDYAPNRDKDGLSVNPLCLWKFPLSSTSKPLVGLSGSSCRDGCTADGESLELYAALAKVAPGRAAEKLELAGESTRRALDQTRALSAELKRLQQEELAGGLRAARELLTELASRCPGPSAASSSERRHRRRSHSVVVLIAKRAH